MRHRARLLTTTLSLLLIGITGCSQQEPSRLNTQEIDLFEAKLKEKGSVTAACNELEVLCKTTGFGCKAHEVFCNVPTKEYICQQLAAACATYPAACDVYADYCRNSANDAGIGSDAGGTCTACTDPLKCCRPADIVCTGTPDEGIVCSCPTLWNCSLDPSTCHQNMPVPTKTAGWYCAWIASAYSCKLNAPAPLPSPISPNWSCQTFGGNHTCIASFPPTPCNQPNGTSFWTCYVDSATKQLFCDANQAGPLSDAGVAPDQQMWTDMPKP